MPGTRVDGATREVVAVQPEEHAELKPESLANRRSDVRLVSVDEDSGVTLIDTPDPHLRLLRKKIEEFADDARVTERGARRNAPAIAPIAELRLARFDDLAGHRARAASLPRSAVRWFEIACRGGYRNPEEFSSSTRTQMRQAFTRLQITSVQEYQATERSVFFVRGAFDALERLLDMVDCVYEFELAGPDVRTFLMYEGDDRGEVAPVPVQPPAGDAPCVSLLDTGISSAHPLLAPLIKGAVCVVPGYEHSPEDTDGHGTEMAGIAAFGDIGHIFDHGSAIAGHWLESARVFVGTGTATARETFRPYWPQMTVSAVEALEALGPSPRVFATAIAANDDQPGRPTYWSHALDRLAYNAGQGRVFFVCAGNADSRDVQLLDGYPTMNLEQKIWDPAQAVNAITVGAYTERTTIAPHKAYNAYRPIAPSRGISPHTSAGLVRDGDAIKPDVVFEGGNVGFDGQLPDPSIPSLTGLTTGHRHRSGRLLSLLWATSEATARAAYFGARLRSLAPKLRPETIRGLVVHSASWTEQMTMQFRNLDDRLAACGFGVPDFELASSCARQRATVIVEDSMPNATPAKDASGHASPSKRIRVLKAFRMPLPEELLLAAGDEEVELRVTLSYFAEPNTFRRHLQRGLDLRWDMQGFQESEFQFMERINKLARGKATRESKTKPVSWQLGVRRRSRGTVQPDRWSGPASLLAGRKLIAVYPVLGWWDRRTELKSAEMPFSLIVTVRGPNVELYESVAAELEAVVPVIV